SPAATRSLRLSKASSPMSRALRQQRACRATLGDGGLPLLCRFLGRRHDEVIHALRRPASEKRQGTKSREVGGGGAADAMGIWPRGEAWGVWSAGVAAIVFAEEG